MKTPRKHKVLGLLDLYGFSTSSCAFHHLAVNYTNEKLHQWFLSHSLRAEQEELVAEGLEWRSSLTFVDNADVCSTLEKSSRGLLALLDEMSLRKGCMDRLSSVSSSSEGDTERGSVTQGQTVVERIADAFSGSDEQPHLVVQAAKGDNTFM